jgi:hypothetical protein
MFLCVGIGGILACGLLLFVSAARIGINDGEWGIISKTGLPSHPELLTWSAWRANDGSVQPFSHFRPLEQPKSLPEYRVGYDRSFLFDFTFYQGRYEHDGMTELFPAIRSGWGATYRPIWAILAFVLSMLSFVARWRFTAPPRSNNLNVSTDVNKVT